MTRTRWLGDWLAFALPALVAGLAGWQAHSRALADLGSLAAAGKAWEALHLQQHANLALIGFDQPPLMTLLYLPFSAFAPELLAEGLAAPLLGAALLGLSVLVICRLGRALDLPAWVLVTLGAAFTLHPLVLSYAALGARAMALIFVLLGLSASLIHWGRAARVRDLVTGGIFAAAAILLAYETVAMVLAAAVHVAWHSRRVPGRAEGTLIAFLLPAAYVAVVWVLADGIIMGQFGHFWRVTTDRAVLAGRDLSRDWLAPLLTVVTIGHPLLMGLVYAHLRRASRPLSGAPAAGMAVAALLSPLVFITLRPVAADGSPWVAMMPLAAAAAGVGLPLLVAFLSDLRRAGAEWRAVLTPGLVLVLVASLYLAGHMQLSGRGLPVGLRSPLRGYPAFASPIGREQAVGRRLRTELAPDRRHIIGGNLAFVVALSARAREGVALIPSNRPPDMTVLGNLEAGSRVVLDDRGQAPARWNRALGPAMWLRLQRRWGEGPWTCYEVARPGRVSGGQSSSPGAIIRP